MAFTLNIASLISGAVTNLFQSALIVGMPDFKNTYVPVFAMCEIPREDARASVRLPGNLTQAGEMRARTVIEASTIELDLIFSDFPESADQSIFRSIQVVLANAAAITNSLASYGAITPNLSGVTSGYVASCLSVLNQIKNYMMPVTILGSYIPLGTIQQTTPYLSSSWYIEEIGVPHDAGIAGVKVTIKLREQFKQRSTSLVGSLIAVATEVAAPNGGSSIGGMF
jgi:hypothetical protein